MAAQRRHAASVKAQVAHASARTSERRIVMYFAPERLGGAEEGTVGVTLGRKSEKRTVLLHPSAEVGAPLATALHVRPFVAPAGCRRRR